MGLSDIAFAAGFRSVRRFNDAFRATYGRPPSSFRWTVQRFRSARELNPDPVPLDMRGYNRIGVLGLECDRLSNRTGSVISE
jgi:AraC-like DNA-binding protein